MGANRNWDAILRPFKTDIWLATLIWVLVGSCVFTFAHLKGCEYALEGQTHQDDFNLVNSFFFQVKAICGQGRCPLEFPSF